MSEKKKILLRIDGELYTALAKWAANDLRSINAQLEFLLKDSVRRAGRLRPADDAGETPPDEEKEPA
jgi:hypothetical protein